MVGKDVILGMLKLFVKKLDVVIAGWNAKSCHWLGQDWIFKS